VHERTVGKRLRRVGLTRLQPRPSHPKKDPAAQEAFKNVWPAPPASNFGDMIRSVCINVSGLGLVTPAKMEIRAPRSS
jgi:hypothetical protein